MKTNKHFLRSPSEGSPRPYFPGALGALGALGDAEDSLSDEAFDRARRRPRVLTGFDARRRQIEGAGHTADRVTSVMTHFFEFVFVCRFLFVYIRSSFAGTCQQQQGDAAF